MYDIWVYDPQNVGDPQNAGLGSGLAECRKQNNHVYIQANILSDLPKVKYVITISW